MMSLEKGKCCISPFPCLGGSSKNGMRFYSYCVAVYQQEGVPQGLGMRLCCGGCRLGAIFGGNLFSIRFLRGVRSISTENSGAFAYHQKREANCSPWKACAEISVIGLAPGGAALRNRGRGLKSLLEDLARALGQYRSLHGERGLKSQGQAGHRAGAFGVAFRMGSVD